MGWRDSNGVYHHGERRDSQGYKIHSGQGNCAVNRNKVVGKIFGKTWQGAHALAVLADDYIDKKSYEHRHSSHHSSHHSSYRRRDNSFGSIFSQIEIQRANVMEQNLQQRDAREPDGRGAVQN